MRRHWYLTLLFGSMVIVTGTVLFRNQAQTQTNSVVQEENAPTTAPEEVVETVGPVNAQSVSTPQAGDLEENVPVASDSSSGKLIASADFSGVLFIGDSRTVGLSEYGDLGNADVFANTGMSSFNLAAAEETVDGEKMTLQTLLSTKQYDTILLMLGINELGYPENQVVRQYRSVVDEIRSLQPNAKLVLQANLHVTAKKAQSNPVYSNEKLNALNAQIQQIAADTGCAYLDENPLFDDAEGNLAAEYSADGAHILGKYYKEWTQWLAEQ